MKRGVVIYENWAPLLRRLPASLRGEVVLLVLDYSSTGEQGFTGDPAADMLLAMMYAQVGEDIQKFEEKCESISEARRAAGAAGAVKRWQNMANDSKNSNCHFANGKNSKDSRNINRNRNKNKTTKENHTLTCVSKESDGAADAAPAPAPRIETQLERFTGWLGEHCPYIATHLKLPTADQLAKLCATYGTPEVAQECLAIENRVDLRRRYSNLYLTLTNWLKKDYGENRQPDKGKDDGREQRRREAAELIARLAAEDDARRGA